MDYMALAGAGMSLAGGITGAMGSQSGGAATAEGARRKAQAEAAAARFNAAQFEFTADIADRDRVIAGQQTMADVYDINRKNVAQIGQIRAAYGWSGLSMEGSPLDIIEASAIEQDLDIRKTLYTGEVVAAGLQDRANQARAQASLLRYTADNAIFAGDFAASGAGTAANFSSAAALLGGVGGAFKSFTPALPRA